MEKILKGLVFLIILILIGGCAPAKKEKVSLQLAIWGRPSEPQIQRIIKSFEKEHPGIKIKLISIPSAQYYQKLQTMIAGGTAPDLAWLAYDQIPIFASKKVLVKLDPLIKKDSDFKIEDYYPAVIDTLSYQGSIYGLARDFTTFVLYYNKDMFDQAGLKYPDKSWDWDKFLAAAKRLTKDTNNDGRIDQFGFRPEPWFDSWAWWVWSNGGRILSEDRTKCEMDNPKTIEALQFVADLRNKYYVAPSIGEAKDLGASGADMMQANQLAMYVNGRWVCEVLRENKELNFDVAEVPRGRGGRVTVLFTVAYVLLEGGKQREEAWEFVKFAGGTKGQAISGDSLIGRGIPAVRKVAQSKTFLNPDVSPRNTKVFLEAADKYARMLPVNPEFARIYEVINPELELVWLGKKRAKQACRKITREVNEILSPGR